MSTSSTKIYLENSSCRRVVVIVLDGVGAGAAPDADLYGDEGANSLGHAATAVGGLKAPNLAALGLGCITQIQGLPATATAPCGYGKMLPQSPGKDTVSGHWELMGIRLATRAELAVHDWCRWRGEFQNGGRLRPGGRGFVRQRHDAVRCAQSQGGGDQDAKMSVTAVRRRQFRPPSEWSHEPSRVLK